MACMAPQPRPTIPHLSASFHWTVWNRLHAYAFGGTIYSSCTRMDRTTILMLPIRKLVSRPKGNNADYRRTPRKAIGRGFVTILNLRVLR